MSKLRLTETQFDRLMQFINETPYDKVMTNSVKVGDIIRIEYRNSTSNFKVIDATHRQIQMDNIDSGSANINYRYFITSTSLHGTDLEIRRAHKIKEKDKLGEIKSWKSLDVKDIKNIEVIRNNSVIDSVDAPKIEPVKEPVVKKTDDKQHYTQEVNKILDEVRDRLLASKENEKIIFNLVDGSTINFCVASKNGLAFKLEVINVEGNPTKYQLLTNASVIEMGFNNSPEQDDLDEILIKYTGDKIGLRLTVFNGENKQFTYIYFKSFKTGGLCDEAPVSKTEDAETPEEIKKDAEQMMTAILNDPLMKTAFYKQPTLWNVIVSAMRGENPKGTGIGPARDIINKYGFEKARKQLGPDGNNFKEGKKAKFSVLKEVSFNGKDSLMPKQQYFAWVRKHELGDEYVMLENKGAGLVISIIEPIPNYPDTFNVKITKSYKQQTKGTTSDVQKDAVITFKSETNSGYYKDSNKTK